VPSVPTHSVVTPGCPGRNVRSQSRARAVAANLDARWNQGGSSAVIGTSICARRGASASGPTPGTAARRTRSPSVGGRADQPWEGLPRFPSAARGAHLRCSPASPWTTLLRAGRSDTTLAFGAAARPRRREGSVPSSRPSRPSLRAAR